MMGFLYARSFLAIMIGVAALELLSLPFFFAMKKEISRSDHWLETGDERQEAKIKKKLRRGFCLWSVVLFSGAGKGKLH